MNFLQECELRYYSKDDSTEVLGKMHEELDSTIVSCEHALLCIFNDILKKAPCCYWDKAIYTQTSEQLEKIIFQTPNIVIDENIVEYFIIAYHTYVQISDIINDLSELNDTQTIRNRQYRIPTYISIVEGCLANLFHFIALLLDQTSSKDYSSLFKLNTLCEVMKKNSFSLLTKDIDVNIRNAINHGGIIFREDGKIIDFHYNENHHSVSSSLNYYEFDNLIERVYDAASAIILGVTSFLNNHWANVSIDMSKKAYVPFCMNSMALSIPSIRCRYLSEIADNKQLNADIVIENCDRTFILQTAIEFAMLIYKQYNDYEKYFISFSNDRLQTSWVRFTNDEVYDMISKRREIVEVTKQAINRKDVIIFDPSNEKIDLQEIKYFRFPNYRGEKFNINHITDASLPDQKRLKCNLFVGSIDKREEIIEIINEGIKWLKTLKNIGSPTLYRKHGDMEADALYINIYHFDARRNKELFPSNENFICFVDYNINGNTTLKYGGLPSAIWNQFYHEKIGKINIAWRESKYIRRKSKKIGANELCPCGSGKKYKKCCRENGIYD